jgi:2-amino-4-hydroxy-6-hydroxymethyldihydropteridine diphosphokinase
MEENRFVVCLGSNIDRQRNIFKAGRMIASKAGFIKFCPARYTKSIGMETSVTFLNQVVVGDTNLDKESFVEFLKFLEYHLGRTDDEKQKGIIKIDADLLMWNDEIIRPEDFERDYIRESMAALQDF